MGQLSTRPLAAAFYPVSASDPLAAVPRFAVFTIIGALALTLSAKAQIPFYPVPLTLQTLVLLLIGATFGARMAVAAVVAYLIEGAIGLPVFAFTPEKGVGLAYMAGPTGGFLASYIPAAFLIGWFAERGADRSLVKLAAVLLAAEVLIFSLGFGWLATFVGPQKAWALGVAPFLVPDAIKVALVTTLVMGVGKLARR